MTLKTNLTAIFCFCTILGFSQAHKIEYLQQYSEFTSDLEPGTKLGNGVKEISDLDRDGNNEIAVSRRAKDYGEVLIYFLNDDLSVKKVTRLANGENGIPNDFINKLDFFGENICALPDLDGDGVSELCVSRIGKGTGEVVILYLASDGNVKKTATIKAGMEGFVSSMSRYEYFGSDITFLGDTDKDGNYEIVIGSAGGENQDRFPGRVWLLEINSLGEITYWKQFGKGLRGFSNSISDSAYLGNSIAVLGDLDKDGMPDLAVGAYYSPKLGAEKVGEVWIVYLNKDLTVKSSLPINWKSPKMNLPNVDGTVFGFEVVSRGDLDGDSIPDFISCHFLAKTIPDSIVIDFVYLNRNGSVKQHVIKTAKELDTLQIKFNHHTEFGLSMDIVDDVNDDNKRDLLIGARNYDINTKFDRKGKFFLFSMDGPEIVSTNDLDISSSLRVYPNPATQQVQISGIPRGYAGTVVIKNQLGQTLYQSQLNGNQNRTIEISQLQAGMYFIVLQNVEGKQTVKLMVN